MFLSEAVKSASAHALSMNQKPLNMGIAELEPRQAGFVLPRWKYTLDSLGEITAKAAQHVTRSHGWNIMGTR
jgi:hypothetical protein